MDQLPTDQQEALRKTNTERLRLMAAKRGDVEDDELETMDKMAAAATTLNHTAATAAALTSSLSGSMMSCSNIRFLIPCRLHTIPFTCGQYGASYTHLTVVVLGLCHVCYCLNQSFLT